MTAPAPQQTASPECPFCKSANSAIRYRFDGCSIYRCADCELMFLFPHPTAEELKSLYDDHYFTNDEFLDFESDHLYGYVDYIAERVNKQYEYTKIVREAKDLLTDTSDRKPRWLDVGCGLGYLLDVAFDEGFDVNGVEYNRDAVDYIRSKYVYPVEHGTIADVDSREKFGVISMMDVIEHLQDPFQNLIEVRSRLADGGLLVITTMDSESFVSRVLGKRLEDFRRTREHLFFFSRRSITRVLEKEGFDVVRIGSRGHTFRLGSLIERLACYSPALSKIIKALVFPRWLLEANIYMNPHTKMIVYARPSHGSQR